MVEKVLQLNREKPIFWTLIAILFLLSGFYMYMITTTISNVVLRQNLESESSALSLSIGSKEFNYISKRNSVTLAMAHEMGFRDSNDKIYVARNSASKFAYLSN